MQNFDYINPTMIKFGRGQITTIHEVIPKEAKVMVLYGGGSIKRTGIYDQVMSSLDGYDVVEFSGIPSNPEYEVLMDAVSIVREQEVNFLLAVGGGSVIDGTKFISAASVYDGDDAWDLLTKQEPIMEAVPFGTVLTMPATGSEMNYAAVITKRATSEKLLMQGVGIFPQFSVLDPTVVSTIPERQLSNGLIDSFVHVLEQYLTYPVEARLQDRFAESILNTLVDIAPKVKFSPSDYGSASDYMWCCTNALNGMLHNGVPQDWGIHMIGHEITAMYHIDHAITLAIVAPSYYQHLIGQKEAKLAQFAERIAGVTEGTPREKAVKAIEFIKSYFLSLGVTSKLSDYVDCFDQCAENISKTFKERQWLGLGEKQNVTPEMVEQIVKAAY
ncbi:iron-containing alcohol dehydrogenase [Halosquirtibacter xylanolyticus]|uniref:iron-containing alcohol dehydrogenase n=1 Tax=Halosquirtibacter xylanolyticus TaxID=3374599 RepID=UPI00374988B3|nr:iron-containing alcohol dehydrogenase [Prolixibacteraceae bacterium]